MQVHYAIFLAGFQKKKDVYNLTVCLDREFDYNPVLGNQITSQCKSNAQRRDIIRIFN